MEWTHGIHTWNTYTEYIHGVHTWNTYIECIHWIHAWNTWTTYMEYIHGVHTWSTYMEYIHGLHTRNTCMEYVHEIHTWNTYMEHIHKSLQYFECLPPKIEALVLSPWISFCFGNPWFLAQIAAFFEILNLSVSKHDLKLSGIFFRKITCDRAFAGHVFHVFLLPEGD